MKLYVAFVLLIIGTALAQVVVDNGQPDCILDLQLGINYVNKADPTTFWLCVEIGQPPVLGKCPEGTVFISLFKSCVNLPDILSDIVEKM